MLQWDTKYLLFLLLLPCWWLLQEAKVNKKHKWSSIMFRRNWMQLHPRCPATHGSPCLPVLTPSRQRTSRKSAYSSRLIFSLLKIKTLVHSKLCFCSIVCVLYMHMSRYNFQIGTLLSVFLWLRITDVRWVVSFFSMLKNSTRSMIKTGWL